MDELLATAEGLRKSGYRPEKFRPYGDGQVLRAAAVWARDGRDWRIGWDLTAAEVATHAETFSPLEARLQAVPSLEARLQAVPGPAKAGTPTHARYIPFDVASTKRLSFFPSV